MWEEALQWVLSQFYYSPRLEEIVPNVGQAIVGILSSLERDDSPNHMKQLEDVQDLTCKLECWFRHGWKILPCKKLRMKEATNELASLISSLNLGSKELPIEEYVQLAREEIIELCSWWI